MQRTLSLATLTPCLIAMALAAGAAAQAQDLATLPANTWVELQYATGQPADPEEAGQWIDAGWNKIVYDPDVKRVLFYDRWYDKKHGGATIYGNCLYAFDPATATLAPIRLDNWGKIDTPTGGYRTVPLAENEAEPTPVSRHVYHAFDYVPEFKSVFICNGANQTVMKDGQLVGHDECDGAWRLDLRTNSWMKIASQVYPSNTLDDAMAWCPDIKSLIYTGANGQLWILNLERGQWRKAMHSPPPRTAFGRTICYDPSQKRMLLVGGGRLDAWQKGEAREFRELFAFDPQTETVEPLAEGPTAFYESQLAYDSKRGLFVTVAVFNNQEQPSGMFSYDPQENAWREISPANPIPPHTSWHGWMKLCYATDYDCFIGMIRDKIFAFRLDPAR